MADLNTLVTHFGTLTEVAAVARVDKSAVVRWKQKKHFVAPQYQSRLIKAARERHMPVRQIAAALDVPCCPKCGTYHVHIPKK